MKGQTILATATHYQLRSQTHHISLVDKHHVQKTTCGHPTSAAKYLTDFLTSPLQLDHHLPHPSMPAKSTGCTITHQKSQMTYSTWKSHSMMTPKAIMALFADAAMHYTPNGSNPSDNVLTAMQGNLTLLLLTIPYDKAGTYNLIDLIKSMASYTATEMPSCNQTACHPITWQLLPTPLWSSTPVGSQTCCSHPRLGILWNCQMCSYQIHSPCINKIWYKDLKNPRTFNSSMTAMELLNHLDVNCGSLHPSKHIILPTEMMGYYMQAGEIPECINMLKEAQRKLAWAQLPMGDPQLLVIASTSVLASQHFPCTTGEWEALALSQKLGPTGKPSIVQPTLQERDRCLKWAQQSHLATHMQSLPTPFKRQRRRGRSIGRRKEMIILSSIISINLVTRQALAMRTSKRGVLRRLMMLMRGRTKGN